MMHEADNDLTTIGNPYLDVLKAVRLCHPGWESVSRVTFVATPGIATKPWEIWKKDIFDSLLAPQFLRAWASYASGNIAGWMEADRIIGEALPAKAETLSRRNGQALMKAYTVPAAEKNWTRLYTAMIEGRTHAHLATVMALRAAAFHVSPRLALSGYVLLESVGEFGSGEPQRCFEMVQACPPPDASANLRAA
ncbi:hypothetical protein DB345_12125 [Spartobacteria bacterium LR76]|nr:hypothetical protein DB345_12125 [Spartobacteria bacterium LR76]